GYEALPTTVRTSRRSCSSRSTSGLRSTMVTSLASSRAKLKAAVVPTCPAPRMRIFIGLHQLQVGVGDDEPLRPRPLEIDLHARARAAAFRVEHEAHAALAVPHALAKPHRATGRRQPRRAAVHRARHDHGRTDFLDEL